MAEIHRCECVCDFCSPERSGPAAYEVRRGKHHGGQVLKVCTKCDLNSDTEKKLIVDRSTPTEEFEAWDGLGFFLLAIEIEEQSPPKSGRFVDV